MAGVIEVARFFFFGDFPEGTCCGSKAKKFVDEFRANRKQRTMKTRWLARID